MRNFRLGTLIWCLVAMLSVVLVLSDPLANRDHSGEFVSIRADQRRVFPGLGDFALSEASIEIQPARGSVVRIVVTPEGHQVVSGDDVLGPADAHALEGLWSALRMATTMRGVDDTSGIRAGVGGSLRVRVSGEVFTVEFGDALPGDSGRYANIVVGRESEAWVVESDFIWPVAESPESWISRGLVQLDAEEVMSITWAEALRLQRGADQLWRVMDGGAPAILSSEAIQARLERVLSTPLDPMISRSELEDPSWSPWLLIGVGEQEETRGFSLGGPCPGEEETAMLVDRGPGVVGCIPNALIDPWRVEDPAEGFLESQLVPVEYGRVLRIRQQSPAELVLERASGGWALRASAEDAAPTRVSEGEVYRWFSRLRAVRITGWPEGGAAKVRSEYQIVIEGDRGVNYRLDCGRVDGGGVACRRDGGPLHLAVGATADPFLFDQTTFEDKTLVDIRPMDVRELELSADGGVPGGDEKNPRARTSVRSDFGAWRLDAPEHPDLDAALDHVRLEQLVTTLSSLRAIAWGPSELGDVERTITLGVAGSGAEGPRKIEIALGGGCRCRVDGGRVAVLDARTCAALSGEVLFDDPARGWLREASSVEWGEGADVVIARREGDAWDVDARDPRRATDMESLLRRLENWRSERIVAVDEGASFGQRVVLRRDSGVDVTLGVSEVRVHVAGQPWAYEGAVMPPSSDEEGPPELGGP